MIITDQISERVRLETVENTTFSFVKNLWEAVKKLITLRMYLNFHYKK
jgi:hypothetical protein